MAWPAPWRDRYCRRPTYSRPPTGRCGSPLLTRGVLRFDGTEWRLFTTADGLAAAEAYINFVETRDGALWVTCLGEGLSRFDGERWTIHKPMDVVWFVGVWLSQDGDLWTGVPSGRLARFDGRDWQTYSADQVQQILGPSSRGRRLDGMVTSDGVFWLSTDEVAARLDPAGPTRYRHPDGLFGGFEDPAGGVWFHTDHLAVHHRDGEWIGHTAADGFLDGEVYGAWQAANGDVWFVGTHSGETAVARRSGERWRVYTTADGLIDRIYVDAVTDSGLIEAVDGEEGVKTALAEIPDLILLDIQLPKLSGYDVARQLKADQSTKEIPIIAITSYALDGDDSKALEAGCDDYIAKPYRPNVLRERLAKFLAS